MDKKEIAITFWTTPAEKERFRAKAEQEGRSLSGWIRWKLQGDADEEQAQESAA